MRGHPTTPNIFDLQLPGYNSKVFIQLGLMTRAQFYNAYTIQCRNPVNSVLQQGHLLLFWDRTYPHM